ncbi:flavodoxin domain-containing protein [Mucilaginibacter sp. UR6-11]|uniref:flavodoxin domain-containing protein n=1 Tax=Mucilaginibacter sp. UR6-11 TaxID=1435644 RepID=UPI001E49A149|nr:flavodoxin domain-containing protein [Mucilaginibacter sp. UR6-11]MCC8426413.1 flavodoxin domain-containing protein [Mucilaginibacter sp. UR6-11]
MKGIIIYQGRYGATDQYAHWLADALGLPLLRVESATPATLAGYDLIILGSSVYVGKLLIAKWIDQNAGLLAEKKVFLFIVCGTTSDDSIQQQQLIHNNLGRAISRSITWFFLPGRCIISKLSWKDRLVLKIGAWFEKNPKKKRVMKQGFDELDRRHLDKLIAAVRATLKETAVC